MKQIGAFFDIDGTLYRDSLMVEHFKKLLKIDMIDSSLWHNHLKETYLDWDKRQVNYDDYLLEIANNYIHALTGLDKKSIDFTSELVIKQKADRVYRYTRSRIKWHIENNHKVIFISGSPDFLVGKMAKKYKATDFRGSGYIFKDNLFTGKVNPMWDATNKNIAINEFIEKYNIDPKQSFAYGDTNGDLTILEKVGHPKAINPTKELICHSLKSDILRDKIEFILERKDVIYKLDKNLSILNLNDLGSCQ